MSIPTERPFRKFQSEAWNMGSTVHVNSANLIDPELQSALASVGERVRNSIVKSNPTVATDPVRKNVPTRTFSRAASTMNYPIVSDPFAASSRSTSGFARSFSQYIPARSFAPPAEEEDDSFANGIIEGDKEAPAFGEGELGWGDGDAAETNGELFGGERLGAISGDRIHEDDDESICSPAPSLSPPGSPSRTLEPQISSSSPLPPANSASLSKTRSFKTVPSFVESRHNMLSNLRAQTFSSPEVDPEEAETFRRHASAGWREDLIPAEKGRLESKPEEPWKDLNLHSFANVEDF
ncbi:hypothetical protein [Phaffia rhodozyma]|uniref:Uncharacterized protein n=1 Tax=Phaffia rhodozyma TaxID=264483 RepID=A0A0F7SRS1_PHARH|nr:hypothetical protein [Phaffia rhodozyma]